MKYLRPIRPTVAFGLALMAGIAIFAIGRGNDAELEQILLVMGSVLLAVIRLEEKGDD